MKEKKPLFKDRRLPCPSCKMLPPMHKVNCPVVEKLKEDFVKAQEAWEKEGLL